MPEAWNRRLDLYELDVREPVAHLDWEGAFHYNGPPVRLPKILFADVPVTIRTRYATDPWAGGHGAPAVDYLMIVRLSESSAGTGPVGLYERCGGQGADG